MKPKMGLQKRYARENGARAARTFYRSGAASADAAARIVRAGMQSAGADLRYVRDLETFDDLELTMVQAETLQEEFLYGAEQWARKRFREQHPGAPSKQAIKRATGSRKGSSSGVIDVAKVFGLK